MANMSTCLANSSNCTAEAPDLDILPNVMPYILVACYVLTCVLGLLGNGLVIYVVLCFAKMKTVTNMYVLNLAIADVLFLFGLPFLITTTLLKYWTFGFAMCKLFFVLYSINWFTSVFTLTVMSADRYLAVCYPVKSVKYRTPNVSRIVCFCVWSLSFLVMLPIMLYATTVNNQKIEGKMTCTIEWPKNQVIQNDKAFTWYSLLLGFAIPVALISVFYVLVILRLRTVGPVKKSKEKKRSHRKVTRMVLTVIAVYVISWLPYWSFQVHLTLAPQDSAISAWKLYMFNGFTALSYANSMLNPLLYAFLSDNFRKSFMKAFKCVSWSEANRTLYAETSMFPRHSHQNNKCCPHESTNITESFEFTTNTNTTTVVRYDHENTDPSSTLCNNEECGENGGMDFTDEEAV